MTSPSTGEPADRSAWVVDPSWVWSTDNPDLTMTAPLRVELFGQSARPAFERWLAAFAPDREQGASGPEWVRGGVSVGALAHGEGLDRAAVSFELCSSGEDALESLEHAAQWLYRDVVASCPDVTVRWSTLPLRDTGSP